MDYGPQFSSLLREVRRALKMSQDIGRAVDLGHGAWQSYEQRSKLPSVENLFRIADRLATKFPGQPIPSQAQFLEAWVAAHGIVVDERIVTALRGIRPHRPSLTELSWLKCFVFTGERRERWARTRLDCLIEPAAMSDLRCVHALRLDPGTALIPDKELTARSWEELTRRYGDRDIVSISSGAVNAMTGLLNEDMVFRFDVMPEARLAYRSFIRDMDHLEHEPELRMFQQCLDAADHRVPSHDPAILLREAGLPADDPRFVRVAESVNTLLGGSTPSQFTSLFRQAVVDPLSRRRYQPEKAFDYAIVSFARHPFGSPSGVALVIAGTNGVATAGAVQALAAGQLEDRPLGAVVSVRVSKVLDADGVEMPLLVPEIVTPAYDCSTLIESLDRIIDGHPAGGARTMVRSMFANWSDEDLIKWKELVGSLGDVLRRR